MGHLQSLSPAQSPFSLSNGRTPLRMLSPAAQISERSAFYASSGAGLAGLVLTALFLPDTTGLDLHEIDRMSRYLLAGHFRNYHGKFH